MDLGMLLALYPPPRPLTPGAAARQARVSTVSADAATVLTCPARDTEPEPEAHPRKKEP
ncbi:hypothetical protein GCM10009830_37810 [Glycomyces endophyticus]|uniref:Uncharacterized protein n=1 Tax=Glycomyces endophyticus TaxID=480996 RepID=A0ABP4TEK0_9ACTN